jgi:hypothetical protein
VRRAETELWGDTRREGGDKEFPAMKATQKTAPFMNQTQTVRHPRFSSLNLLASPAGYILAFAAVGRSRFSWPA